MGVLVGRKAPNFTAAAVLGTGEIVDSFNFYEHIQGKKAVLFFYPLDFTFVCPSELIAFDHRLDEFKKRGVEVMVFLLTHSSRTTRGVTLLKQTVVSAKL